MAYGLAVFSSLNLVNRMKSSLNRDEDYFAMTRAPQSIAAGGCGFALRFEDSKLPLVRRTARELGIAIDGIYIEGNKANGSKTYIPIEDTDGE